MISPKGSKESFHIRDSFKKMTFSQKIDYIIAYYKFPVITAIIAAAVLISTAVRYFTRKETVLCAAFANVSVGETLSEDLTDRYLLETERSLSKNEIIVYRDLYLTSEPSAENHQYAYASKLKVLGAVNARQLDIVLMNREAYDLMSSSGFLLDLDEALSQDQELYQRIRNFLCENTVIIEDNAVAFSLGEAETYESVTEDAVNAVDCSSFPYFEQAGFPDTVYFGIIANSTRTQECLRWLSYISGNTDGNS